MVGKAQQYPVLAGSNVMTNKSILNGGDRIQ